MKNFLNSLCSFFQEMGRAKAATALARSGHYKEARDLMAK